jgi:hypothetical protein
MIDDAKDAMDNAPNCEDLTDDYERMVKKVKQVPETANNAVEGLIESISKDMEVWHDRQIEQLKETSDDVQKRSQAFKAIVKTFERLQDGILNSK